MAVESIAGQEDPGSSLTTEESGEQYTTDKYGNRIRVDAGRYLDDYGNPLLAWGWGDPLPQGVVDFAAGFGDTLSFGGTAAFRELWNGNRVVDFDSGEYYGGVASGVPQVVTHIIIAGPLIPKRVKRCLGDRLSVIGLGTEGRVINQSGTASDERLDNR